MTLEELKKKYKQYITENYVYKLCNKGFEHEHQEQYWIVVMKKTKKSFTNEDRKNVIDSQYAKFRANELEVVKIINMFNPHNTIKEILHVPGDQALPRTRYIEGKIVYSDKYDFNRDIICSNGIHYFKNIDAAFYYKRVESQYTGFWRFFDDDGNLVEEGQFIKGHKNGLWRGIKDLSLSFSGKYLNDRKIGKWIYHYIDDSYQDYFIDHH